jgi:hypothetical protein
MRYAKIPEPFQLRDIITKVPGEKLSFQQYAVNLWLNDERWTHPKSHLARLVRVLPEFEKPPGDWMAFEDQDWAIIKSIIDDPKVLLVPLVQVQVGPVFEDVILSARTDDPFVHKNPTYKEPPS